MGTGIRGRADEPGFVRGFAEAIDPVGALTGGRPLRRRPSCHVELMERVGVGADGADALQANTRRAPTERTPSRFGASVFRRRWGRRRVRYPKPGTAQLPCPRLPAGSGTRLRLRGPIG